MALTTYPVYGDSDAYYDILQDLNFFTSVTKSVVQDGSYWNKIITCSDAYGQRFVSTFYRVNEDGSGGQNASHIYHYGTQGHILSCGTNGADQTYGEASLFPQIVYKTESSLVVLLQTNGYALNQPLKYFVLTKDNNGVAAVLTTNNGAPAQASTGIYRVASKDASSVYQPQNWHTISSATTLVPATTNDLTKVTFLPKVFRAVNTQLFTTQPGLATLNNNDYLCLYGPVFIRID